MQIKTINTELMQAKCPNCGRRLLDYAPDTTGKIEIKCPKCKEVISLRINDKQK